MRPSSKSFIFLGDVLRIKGIATISLFDDYKLKKPNKAQLGYIKKFIDNYTRVVFFKINRFENRPTPEGGGHRWQQLDEKDWNYWVIEHTKAQMDKRLPLVLGLSQSDLTVLFEGIYWGVKTIGRQSSVPGIMCRQLSAINFFQDMHLSNLMEKEITSANKMEFRILNESLKEFEAVKKNYDFIDKALEDILVLGDISKQSPFRVLGYFSILELLLTTYRQKGTNENSISNQLQKKINLLNNQFKEKIDFTIFFKGPDTLTIEIIFEKLYKYRNAIAHGNKSDFESELQILKDRNENILNFLHMVLKKILIEAINKPQLIKDLKEC